jgi:signal transduction histidine kinase
MNDLVRLRHAVGGPSFLARGPLLLLIPTSLLTSLLSRTITDLWELVGWIVANLVAFLVCWAWVWLFDRTAFRSKAVRPVAVPVVVAFGASLGAMKGALTDLAGSFVGVGPLVAEETVWRSLGTAVLGAVVVPAVAALKVAVDRYRTAHALLVAEMLGGMRAPENAATPGVTDFVVEARRELASVEPAEAATTILRLVDGRLRPLTHELWASVDQLPAELDLASLLRIAVLRNPLPLAGITLPYALSVWPVSVQAAGLFIGTLRSVAAGLGLLAVIVLARTVRAEHAWTPVAVLHLVVTILVATAVQVAQWDLLLGGMPMPSSPGLWITVGTWLTALILVSGAVSGALRTRAMLREQVLRVLGPEALRALALEDHDRLEAQRIATRLHSDLQGRMVATARRIEQLSGDEVAIAAEVAMLDRVLAGLGVDMRSTDQGAFAERLDALSERWRGFLDISVAVEAAAGRLTDHHADRLERVVDEAVVNAIRHGLATSVGVVIQSHDDSISVTVTDDGVGPRNGRPGLGSTFFDLVSAGAWTLTAERDGGTALRLDISF